MAWSYTQPNGERNGSDGSHFCRWWNSWSVTEVSPVTPGKIRLRVSLSSNGFYRNSGYVWYCTDAIRCGDAYVVAREWYVVSADCSYTTHIEVPSSWSGQQVTLSIGWLSVNVTLTASATTPSTVAAGDGTFGQALPIRLTPSFQGVRHTLTVRCAGNTETLLERSADTSFDWTPAVATYAPLLPNAASAEAVIACETFYGELSMGSDSVTVTLRFADGALTPELTAGWATAEPLNEGTAAAFTVWIQGVSRAQVLFDANKINCRYGASVAGYTIRCNGVTVTESPYQTGVLPTTAESITCQVTDSRGQTSTETLTVAPLPYAAPRLAEISVYRCDDTGAATEEEQSIAVSGKAIISPLGGENSYTLSARVRTTTGEYGQTYDLTSETRRILNGFSPDTSYFVRIELTDGLGSMTEVIQTLPSRKWAIKFRPTGTGAAFGKAAEYDEALELAEGWALILRDQNGIQTLDCDKLRQLLALL